jgi:polyisoprenoid-binding protein YceI
MKKSILLLTGLLAIGAARAQYKAKDDGSDIKFTIGNFGFNVDGSFKGLQGSIDFDPQNSAAGRFDVSIDAGTVNTDNTLRDGHLRNDGYFDVKNYPRIRLVSTKIAATATTGVYQFTGLLTIKSTTKEVSFPFTVTQTGGGLNFKGAFKIMRKDFGVGGTSTISNELTVSMNVQATRS